MFIKICYNIYFGTLKHNNQQNVTMLTSLQINCECVNIHKKRSGYGDIKSL